MRNKIFAMTIALLTWMVGSAKADSLTVSGTKMNAGTQNTIEVTLAQTTEKYAGFQFDVVLPEGLTLVGQALTKEQTGDMAVTKQPLDGGGIRFMVFSPTLALAHAGKVMELRLKANKKAEAGAYNLKLTNVILSDADGNTSHVEDAVSTVTVVLPVTVTAKSLQRVYGDEGEALSYEISENFTTGTPTISCEATVASSVGTYSIVVGKGSIDADTVTLVNGTLTITKAPLTITAGTYTKKQGEALPAFTLNYEGFKNGETEAVLTKQPSVSCEATEASAPSEYAVTVNGAEAQNYEISYVPGKLTVTPADPITVTAKSFTRFYGDVNPTFEFTSEGAPLDGTPEISCEATATSPVGEYPIIIKKGGVKNYNDTYVNGTLTITKAPLTITAGTYTKKQGEALPAFTLTYEGFKNGETEAVLTKLPTVSCEATEASEPGEYAVTVSNAEAQNYEIKYEQGTLTVTPADPVTVTAKSFTRFYGDVNPTFEFTSEGAPLDGTPEISCEATATSPVGEYPIIIKKGGVKNYNDTYVNGTLTITKAPLTITAGTYTKKQGEALPAFTLTYEGFKNGENEAVLTKQPSVSCEATEASAPGEYAVTVSNAEAQNYEIKYEQGTLTVTPADPVTVTAKSYTRVYGDTNPTFEFTSEGATLDGTPEISCEATATSPVGEYPIIIKKGGVKNYNDTYVNGTLTITKAPLTIKAGTYTKKQGEALPEFTLTYEGFKNGETETVLTKQPSVSCEATEASVQGEYAVTVSNAEDQNYEIKYEQGTLTVTPADPVTVTAKSYTRVYGDANPTFEFTSEGAPLDGTPEISCEATATSPAGEYPIIIKKGGVKNYNDTYVNGTLTITKAPLTIKAGTYTKKQGEALPAFTLTYEGFKNGETEAVLTKLPTVSCEATEASAPGEYAVTVSGAETQNYEISYVPGKLTVTPADPVTVTAKSYTRVYGDANPTFEFTSEGAPLDGTPEISCEATATSPVGTYPIIIKKGGVKNYNDTYVNGTLTITKAQLTIKAGTYTKKQGEALPAFTLTYEGFKNGETETVLTKQPSVSCEATEACAPGEYAVTVSNAEAQNYEIKYEQGTLTVTPADPVTVTAKSYTRVYGDTNPTFEFTSEGATLDGTPEISCEAKATSPVGEYPIIIKKGGVKNYNDTYVNGTLTITKAPLTIKAGTYTKKQGEALPEFTLTYEGFKNGETETVLTKQPSVSCEATEASEPGDYAVTVSGAEAQNYEIKYNQGTLTVTPADPVTVTAKSYTRVYGEANPTFEFTSEGATLDGSPEISCEATATSPVGEYPIIIKKGGVKNYNDTYVNGTLTITKALLTVKVKDAEREQGEENPAFEIVYNGWKLQDTESVLSKQPVTTTEATKDSPVGEYVITVSGAEAQNYEITYVNGTLTVTVPSVIADILTSGQPFDVYTVTGRKVRHQVTSVKGLPSGVYIVNGRKLVVK